MKKFIWRGLFVLAGFCFILLSCSRKPIPLGLCVSLTGIYADLGLNARNGAMLAVEALNADGGVRGRPLALLVKDDRHDPAEALKADRELIGAGAKVIIGHVTSTMTQAVLSLMNETGTLLISPTASAEQFSGRDDMLINLNTSNRLPARALGGYAAKTLSCASAGILCTTDNAAYADSYLAGFSMGFSISGESFLDIVYYSSKDTDFSYGRAVHQILVTDPDCILIIDSALNSAMFCQNLRKAGYAKPVLVCEWAVGEELIVHGGDSVEGVFFSHQYNPLLSSPGFNAFKESYKRRFSAEPGYAAVYGYEAVAITAQALSQGGNTGVKEWIIDKGRFEGLQETIYIDSFGDIDRSIHVGVIKNGLFQVLISKSDS